MPLPGISLGPDIGGGIGAGLENVEPEMLQQELQKQQVQAGKMQLASDANAMQQQQISQMDAQAAYLAKIGRANPNGATDPVLAAQLNTWAQKRGVPSPVMRNPDGSFKIDFDAIPGSGGLNDMTPDNKARFMALPENERRVEFPGMSEEAYTAQQYISDPKQQDSMRGEFTKLLTGLGNGTVTPTQVAYWLKSTPGVQSVISVPDALEMLKDPQFQAETLGPMARAKIQEFSAIGLSDQAKANYERLLTKVLPGLTAERIAHMQNQDKVGAGKLTVEQQRANTYAKAVSDQQPLIAARINDLNKMADKAAQYVQQHNTPMAAAAVNALGKQATTLGKTLDDVTKNLNSLSNVQNPTEDQIEQMGTLMTEQNTLVNQLQQVQAQQGTLATAVEKMSGSKLSKGSGMETTLQGPQYSAGQAVPGNPDYTFTGKRQGNLWVIKDKDGNLKGYQP